MEAKRKNIRYWIITLVWMGAGTGLLVLLIAAMQSKGRESCRGLNIEFKGGRPNVFVEKTDVQDILTAHHTLNLTGRPLKWFNLHEMEDRLKRHTWIQDAELFFDNNNMLRVNIWEKQPIARIFTQAGNSFYIDSMLNRLPLNEKFSPRLPVFTNFPYDKIKPDAVDSPLLRQVKTLSGFLARDSFWMAEIEQIDINSQHNFEMVPLLGKHIIAFGEGENAERKFNKLMIFYKQVLNNTGWNKYDRIDVQYEGQIVATRTGGEKIAAPDTASVKQFFRQMLAQSQLQMEDSLDRARPNSLLPQGAAKKSATPLKTFSNPPVVSPSPLKSSNAKSPPQPKAVMKKN